MSRRGKTFGWLGVAFLAIAIARLLFGNGWFA